MPGSGFPIEPGRMSIAARLAIMIPPVSVCHQLSWIGRPKASTPQRTASGFSGSPTLAMKRRSGHGCSCASSGPARIIIRTAVGAVYQTRDSFGLQQLVPADRRRSPPRRPRSSRRARAERGCRTTCPVTHPGSAVHQKMSSSWRSSAQRAVARCAAIASCTWTAPLGMPVVPLVKCNKAMSVGAVSATG